VAVPDSSKHVSLFQASIKVFIAVCCLNLLFCRHFRSTVFPELWQKKSKKTIRNTSTYDGPNKLDCFSLSSLYNLVQCNALAYWAHSLATKKMKCSEYSLWGLYHKTFYRVVNLCVYQCHLAHWPAWV
jgi:hypothetical protein